MLSRLAALPGSFDLELAEAVAGAGAGRTVLRLMDRSLVCPAATVADPVRLRLLDSMRAFVLDRTDPAVGRARPPGRGLEGVGDPEGRRASTRPYAGQARPGSSS